MVLIVQAALSALMAAVPVPGKVSPVSEEALWGVPQAYVASMPPMVGVTLAEI
jgi:hypothetical protein